MLARISALVFVLGATALLPACSGGSPGTNPIMPTGLSPHSPMMVRASLVPPRAKLPPDLYIADYATNAVDILRNRSYRDVGAITNGIACPSDEFLDTVGNLYVSNNCNLDVTEYAPRNTGAPNFVYSNGLGSPFAVTTDAHGNVFVADAGHDNIDEFFQQVNGAAFSCTIQGSPLGVAVDSSGDVFFEFYLNGVTSIGEYSGGLKGCNELVLGVTLPQVCGPCGIAVDNHGNILAADLSAVDVIDPPYSTVSGTIGSGFSGARTVKLNRKNTLAYVADPANGTVTIVNYPSGTNVTVLGSSNGLVFPTAAVDRN